MEDASKARKTDGENQSAGWTVCPCNNCSGKLEFESAHAGETIQCPHCGMETVLFIPQVPLDAPPHVYQPPLKPEPKQADPIVTTTGNDVSGRTIESYLGVVRGIVVRSPNIVQGVFGGLKQIVGGNIESYALVCEQARLQAFQRMVEHATRIDADAIIAVRYDATEFAPGVTEVLAYGTAVKLARVS